MMSEPKNPKDMTQAELDALPGWREYNEATSVRKKTKIRSFGKDDIYAFIGSDGVEYHPTFYDGVWYKL